MPTALDTQSTFKKYDKSDALTSVAMLPEQCTQAWSETKAIKFPARYRSCTKIVVCGMGGSGLGGHIVRAVFGSDMKVPLTILNNYDLPNWVDRKTLVISVTYSGTTEEALSMFKEATNRGCPTLAIATGKKLASAAKRAKVPAYIFDDRHTNPANMPRMGLGLTLFAELGILKNLGYITLSDKEVRQAIAHMLKASEAWAPTVKGARNLAKKLATQLHNRVPVYVSSEHLNGNALAARNQTNESAKSYAEWYEIPELNHHLMEGLTNPKETDKLTFLLLSSDLYHKRNQKRHGITAQVIKKTGAKVQKVEIKGDTKLEQALYTFQLTAYLAFYLGMLYKLDPSPIPYVDYFKKRLA